MVSDCEVTSSEVFITPETVEEAFSAGEPDFIVDAIDSVQGKLAIAAYARSHGIQMISCLGEQCQTDNRSFKH